MTGLEIITYLTTNAPALLSNVGPYIGAVLTAVFLRSNTATTEFEKMKAGKFDEVIEDLLASGQMTYTEFYKAKNFLKIAKKADKYYSENDFSQEGTAHDFDWFMRYYESVGNISDEEMQDLWARVLADEICRPSMFSLRTLDVLRNMRKSDADLFVHVCKYAFTIDEGRNLLPNYDEYLDKRNITYSDIMTLNEMGLIFCDGTISLNFEPTLYPHIIFISENLVMTAAAKDENNNLLSISQFPFTNVGNELATLVSECASNDDFMDFGRLVAKNKAFDIAVCEKTKHDGSIIDYDSKNLIE